MVAVANLLYDELDTAPGGAPRQARSVHRVRSPIYKRENFQSHKKLPVPATLNLAEEIRRRKAAEALLAADDSDPDVDPDIAAADKEAADAEAAAQKEVDDQLAESQRASATDAQSGDQEPSGKTEATQGTDHWSQWPTVEEKPKLSTPEESRRAELFRLPPVYQPPDISPARRGELVKTPVEPTPDTLTQVERGELVKAPVEPAPDRPDQVERGELIRLPTEAPSVLSQFERGELIKVPPGTAPKAAPVDLQGQEVKPVPLPEYKLPPGAPPRAPPSVPLPEYKLPPGTPPPVPLPEYKQPAPEAQPVTTESKYVPPCCKATVTALTIISVAQSSCTPRAGRMPDESSSMQSNSIPKIQPRFRSWRRWMSFLELTPRLAKKA
jgi:hypothetical protein